MKQEDIRIDITIREQGYHEAVCNITVGCGAMIDFVLNTFGEKELGCSDRYNALCLVKKNLDLLDAIALHMEEKECRLDDPEAALKYRIDTLEFSLKNLREKGVKSCMF